MVAVGLLIPLLPRLYREAGATPTEIGFFGSAYGVANLLGGPGTGLAIDRLGSRWSLSISMLGAAAGYALLAASTRAAQPVAAIIAARLVIGVFKQTQTIAKAAVAAVTPPARRAAAMGRTIASGSAGFVLGPLVGGYLADIFGIQPICYVTASVFVVNAGVAYFGLPVAALTPTSSSSGTTNAKPAVTAPGTLARLGGVFKHAGRLLSPRVRALIASQVLMGTALISFRNVFAVHLDQTFNASNMVMGVMLSTQGAFAAAFGFSIGPLLRWLGLPEKQLLIPFLLLHAASYIAVFKAPSLLLFSASAIPFHLSSSMLQALFSSLMSQEAPPGQLGSVLGLSDTAMAVSRTVAPTLAGAAMAYGHLDGILGLCLVTALLAIIPQLVTPPANADEPVRSRPVKTE